MDKDVQMSMEQAHEKWITKTIVTAALGALLILVVGGASCDHFEEQCKVQRASLEAQKAHDDAMRAMWEKQKAP